MFELHRFNRESLIDYLEQMGNSFHRTFEHRKRKKWFLPLLQRRVFPAHLQRGCHRPRHFPLFSQSCKTSGPRDLYSNASQRNPMVLELPTSKTHFFYYLICRVPSNTLTNICLQNLLIYMCKNM